MRKGQVTLFIVLGLIILLVVSLGIYVTTRYFISPLPPGESSVQDYVQSCIQQTAARGMHVMAERGGYLSFEREGIPFVLGAEPTEGDALFLSDDVGVAYWWYMKTPNTCSNCALTRDNIPLLGEMEDQLERYIEENVDDCLDGFAPFSDQGIVVATGTMDNQVTFTDNDISISSSWPVTIREGERTTRLQEFETAVDIPIKNLYTLSRQVVTDAVITQRYEHILMHLIATFSDVAFDKLPPIAAVTHDAGVVTWSAILVEQQLTQILSTYMPLVRYQNTRNGVTVRVGEGPEQGVFDALFIDLFDTPSPYEVDVSYLDWPIYFDITPQQAGSLRPDIDRTTYPDDLVPPFQTNYYEFFYDVSVPLLVRVSDPDALKGEGFSLAFAIETNVRDNKNMAEWNDGEGTLGPWSPSRALASATIVEIEAGTCSCDISSNVEDCFDKPATCDLNGRSYDNYTACAIDCTRQTAPVEEERELAPNLFCQPEFATSGTITFKASHAYTGEIIEGAEISYGCGSFAACPLGETDRRGIVRDELPFCFNGYVKTHYDGFYTDTQLFTPQPDERAVINISLIELQPVQLNMSIYDVRNATQDPILQPSALLASERVLVSFERQREETYETPFVQFATIDPAVDISIDLIPGEYEVRAQLVDENGYLIPRACSIISIPDGPAQLLPQDDLAVRPGLRGGLAIVDESALFTVDKEDIVTANTLSFGVLRLPKPNCITSQGCVLPDCVGLEELQRIGEHSQTFISQVMPALS